MLEWQKKLCQITYLKCSCFSICSISMVIFQRCGKCAFFLMLTTGAWVSNCIGFVFSTCNIHPRVVDLNPTAFRLHEIVWLDISSFSEQKSWVKQISTSSSKVNHWSIIFNGHQHLYWNGSVMCQSNTTYKSSQDSNNRDVDWCVFHWIWLRVMFVVINNKNGRRRDWLFSWLLWRCGY